MWLWSVKLEIAERENNTAWRRRRSKKQNNYTKRQNCSQNSRFTSQVCMNGCFTFDAYAISERERKRERQDERIIKWEAICYFLRKHTLFSSSHSSFLTTPSFVCSAAQKFLCMIMRGFQNCSHTEKGLSANLCVWQSVFIKGHVNGSELLATRVFCRNLSSSLWSQTGVKAFVGTFGSILCQACRRTRCM